MRKPSNDFFTTSSKLDLKVLSSNQTEGRELNTMSTLTFQGRDTISLLLAPFLVTPAQPFLYHMLDALSYGKLKFSLSSLFPRPKLNT